MKLSTLQKGLVGHWPLDQESFNPATKRFTDKSACCNHGTGNGTQLGSVDPGFQADRMGRLVRAAPFGGDDYVDCGNDESLNITDVMTITAWIYWVDNGISPDIVAKMDGSYEPYRFTLDRVNMRFNPQVSSSTSVRDWLLSDAGVLAFNKWQYVTWVMNGGNHYFYVDGVPAGSDTSAVTPLRTTTGQLNIGMRKIGSNQFEGNIADTRLYNIPKSQTDITLLHESYRPKVIV